MPRKTTLAILGERPALSLQEENPDTRSVAEVFGAAANGHAPSVQPGLSDDILALLRQTHDRIGGQATEAVERAGHAEKMAQAAIAETAAVKEVALAADKAASSALAAESRGQATARAGLALRQLGLGLASMVSFLVDRAPALMTLAGGWLLWRETLVDPGTLKLIGLGLYGACVVAPATWLTARK